MNFKLNALIVIILLGFGINPCLADNFAKGLLFSLDSEYQSFPSVQKYRAYLPESVDLSSRFPTSGSQGRQGSCVSWSVAYVMRSYYDFSQYNIKPSQNLAFSPAFIYNQIKSEPNNCEGGTSIPKALDLVKAQGLPRISDFPYSDTNCGRQPTQKIRELASQYKIVGWKAIRDIESIKGELYRGNPVVVGMAVSSSFDNLRGKNIYTDERSEPNGPHAMVITGYDDKRRAFKLFNSWGPEWGDNGFGWVGYRAMVMRGKEFYTMEPSIEVRPPEPEPVPTPSPPPPPAPPPTPTPPTPRKVDRQEVQRIADSVECGSLKAAVTDKGAISLTGFAGEQSSVNAVVKKLKAIEGVNEVSAKVQTQPWPICEALKTLEQTTNEPRRLSLKLSGRTNSELNDGDKLAFEIKLDTKNAYLYVDYLQANGEAVALERGQQVTGNKAVRHPPTGKQFVVQAPFGSELLVAILSPKPLFEPGMKYENDREYLSALRQALLGLSASERAQVTSSTISIKTDSR